MKWSHFYASISELNIPDLLQQRLREMCIKEIEFLVERLFSEQQKEIVISVLSLV